jgi:hypothetical protein
VVVGEYRASPVAGKVLTLPGQMTSMYLQGGPSLVHHSMPKCNMAVKDLRHVFV